MVVLVPKAQPPQNMSLFWFASYNETNCQWLEWKAARSAKPAAAPPEFQDCQLGQYLLQQQHCHYAVFVTSFVPYSFRPDSFFDIILDQEKNSVRLTIWSGAQDLHSKYTFLQVRAGLAIARPIISISAVLPFSSSFSTDRFDKIEAGHKCEICWLTV